MGARWYGRGGRLKKMWWVVLVVGVWLLVFVVWFIVVGLGLLVIEC